MTLLRWSATRAVSPTALGELVFFSSTGKRTHCSCSCFPSAFPAASSSRSSETLRLARWLACWVPLPFSIPCRYPHALSTYPPPRRFAQSHRSARAFFTSTASTLASKEAQSGLRLQPLRLCRVHSRRASSAQPSPTYQTLAPYLTRSSICLPAAVYFRALSHPRHCSQLLGPSSTTRHSKWSQVVAARSA